MERITASQGRGTLWPARPGTVSEPRVRRVSLPQARGRAQFVSAPLRAFVSPFLGYSLPLFLRNSHAFLAWRKAICLDYLPGLIVVPEDQRHRTGALVMIMAETTTRKAPRVSRFRSRTCSRNGDGFRPGGRPSCCSRLERHDAGRARKRIGLPRAAIQAVAHARLRPVPLLAARRHCAC
jgi:hypothetical protein